MHIESYQFIEFVNNILYIMMGCFSEYPSCSNLLDM